MIKNSIVIVTLVAIVIVVFAIQSVSREYGMCLKKGYDSYKKDYMSFDGRIMDPVKDNITTSEGQSYMLLSSCLSNDKETFDLVYDWTKNNLQRGDDLFSWLWGKTRDGEYRILDDNTASDADVDIAFALILAYEKWGDIVYLDAAKQIMSAIWDCETKYVGKYLVLMPGVKQTVDENKIEINPSYFSPYAFKTFFKYDKGHNWNDVVDSSYYYLQEVTKKTETGLPPNWFLVKDDQIVLEDSPRSDFSYDAIRVFARVYLDFVMTNDHRAVPVLEKSKFFIDEWKKSKTIYVNYQANGQLRDKDEFVGSIAILVPVINLYDEKVAMEIYKEKLGPLFRDKGYWAGKKDYYSRNLLWFGCYLYKY